MDEPMDQQSAGVVVNREDPIPVVSITSPKDETSSPSKRENLRKAVSPSRLREKLEEVGVQKAASPSIQDRLFASILQQVLPHENMMDEVDPRSRKYVERPNFSIPLMSSNFRRFNSRIGVAFVFQNHLIRLFTWKDPTKTIAFLFTYTFLCVNPYLLVVLPLAGTLLFLMVPAYLTRHPPPPNTAPRSAHYDLHGPPLAAAQTIKPAPEFSKDFFRNMRDLQNSMDDFSRLHDQLVAWIAPPTNFSDEALSSAIFLVLFVVTGCLFIASHLLPWRLLALLLGWTATVAGHPRMQEMMLSAHEEFLVPKERQAKVWMKSWVESDILLDTAPELREVEIFELQRRVSSHANDVDAEYEPWLFSPTPYDPLSPQRISGDRARGTRFFEDVQAPQGWVWHDKKWSLDLLSREWVEERIITGVEVETEGERWVYDILYDEKNKDETVEPLSKARTKAKTKGGKTLWEDGNGIGNRGDWRRRRWIRRVKRKALGKAAADA